MRNCRWKSSRLEIPLISGECLFFAGFIAYLAWDMWSTTMFYRSYQYDKGINYFVMLVLCLKILCVDRFTKKETWLAVAWLMVSLCVNWKTGYSALFYLALCMVGAKGISFRKILKVYLIVVGGFMLLAITFSLLGIIVNLRYKANGVVRNAFGIVYTTDFASHVFYGMIGYFYLKSETLNIWDYLVSIILAVTIYYFCRTRLDVGCMFVTVLAYGGYNMIKNSILDRMGYWSFIKWMRNMICVSIPIAAIISLIVTIAYKSQSDFLIKLNEILSNRLKLGLDGITNYGFKLFGQYVPMIGNGGDTLYHEGYNFIDCSYLSVSIRYGVLWFCLLMLIFVFICRKYKDNGYMLLAIAIIALNCMIAHHIVELSYNIFVMALFARGEVCKD